MMSNKTFLTANSKFSSVEVATQISKLKVRYELVSYERYVGGHDSIFQACLVVFL